MAYLKPLVGRGTRGKTHVGWWFEQLMLYTYSGTWRWNTNPLRSPRVA